MANKIFRKLLITLTTAVVIASFTGCASVPPPNAELDRASIALASAQSEAAENFAPVELRLARDALASANAFVEAGKHDLAKALAERCEVYSELALLKASAGAARAQVAQQNEAIMQLKRDIDAANAPAESLELPPSISKEPGQ
jgi:phage shock protein A